MTATELRSAFTEYIPVDPDPGVLYVSLTYATTVHLCACGCGHKVVTPLSPTGWRLIFDGTASIHPSIGNSQYPCRSHYFIRSNKIVWLKPFTEDQIEASIQHDINARQRYYAESTAKRHPRKWLGRVRQWFPGTKTAKETRGKHEESHY